MRRLAQLPSACYNPSFDRPHAPHTRRASWVRLPLAEVEEVADQKVRTAIFCTGEGRVELLEPTSPESPIAKFLEKRGEGIHHMAVRVTDIQAKLAELEASGAQLIDRSPRVGAGGHLIAFVHPKAAHGVLLELTQPCMHQEGELSRH